MAYFCWAVEIPKLSSIHNEILYFLTTDEESIIASLSSATHIYKYVCVCVCVAVQTGSRHCTCEWLLVRSVVPLIFRMSAEHFCTSPVTSIAKSEPGVSQANRFSCILHGAICRTLGEARYLYTRKRHIGCVRQWSAKTDRTYRIVWQADIVTCNLFKTYPTLEATQSFCQNSSEVFPVMLCS